MAILNPDRFLKSLINYELRPGYAYNLADYERFLSWFNDPHLSIGKVIHIAGTKGKGSIAAVIDSCLRAAGYNVGLYTSPHLSRVNERIKYNGREISKVRLTNYLKSIKPFVKKGRAARTFFEVLTTVAFMNFRNQKCDFSVLEVGLGGRLDATNVAKPLISIIARIGYDHINLLGTKLSQIAREKAGIIKPATPIITIQQRRSAHQIIASIARANASPLLIADQHIKIEVKNLSLKGTDIEIKGIWGNFKTRLPLLGRHQIENLKIALLALYECRKYGYHIGKNALIQGIKNLHLPGRFQVIRQKPLIIFDCAHNPDSFRALHKNIQDFDLNNFILIFGASKFKNINYCINNIFPMAESIILVPLNNPRSFTIDALLKKTYRFKNKIITATSVKQALNLAWRLAPKKPILITGSFFLWSFGDHI
ncbi:hypothetical protein A2Y85_08825 [candidate division WOR-3 bacterium RBG_13_43_14]|uniref:tetrahydrofolate synthase n=1 Tax=candidate division WOR-3 bacterium RBG_13_43_14 TaxID=1802590 RepID=A0A1F4U1R7_UNCW3|nr:MAG: hypothetical protein A2Y85_08825 [candidate division WOR-3 bacterium RBG_13_43_14]